MAAVVLKGSLFTLSTLQIHQNNIKAIQTELMAKTQMAPNFFNQVPIVLDLTHLEDANNFDLSALKTVLIKCKLIPVGVQGASAELQKQAQENGLAIIRANTLPKTKSSESTDQADKQTNTDYALLSKSKSKPTETETPEIAIQENMTITQPIRSGQQVYCRGDLTVLAPVSAGAELLAEGNIHIYSTLRGRALAGVNGNRDARIFCQRLEAELVSIAGEYQVFEDKHYPHSSKPTQVYLTEDKLIAEAL